MDHTTKQKKCIYYEGKVIKTYRVFLHANLYLLLVDQHYHKSLMSQIKSLGTYIDISPIMTSFIANSVENPTRLCLIRNDSE